MDFQQQREIIQRQQHWINHLRFHISGYRRESPPIPSSWTLYSLGFESQDEINAVQSCLQSFIKATEKMYAICLTEDDQCLNLDIVLEYPACSNIGHPPLKNRPYLFPFWRGFCGALLGFQTTLLLSNHFKHALFSDELSEHSSSTFFSSVQRLILSNVELDDCNMAMLETALGCGNYFGSIQLVNNNIQIDDFSTLMSIIGSSQRLDSFKFEHNHIPDTSMFLEVVNSLKGLRQLVLRGQTSDICQDIFVGLKGEDIEILKVLDCSGLREC
jgi:hypothetical protein